MTTTQFSHSGPALTAGTTRTLLYGPVPGATTVVVFAGLFSNIDNTSMVNHWVTLELFDGTNYTNKLNQVPIPFGGASECPKLTVLPGESLYVTSDVAGMVECSVEVLVLS